MNQNRINLISALKRQNHTISQNPITADIIHNIWWNTLLSSGFFNKIIRHHPRIIVTASNFIDPGNPDFSLNKEFKSVMKIAKGWLAYSSKQKKILDDYGLLCFQMPPYVNHSIFHPPEGPIPQYKLYSKYGIPEEVVHGRTIIGSFQRDSLGSDLSKPKWQKNPDCLIALLEKCDKNKYLLLLAGPRRHYIINQCRKRNIPYFYIGKETMNDDIYHNTLPISAMVELYWISDLILVTSRSEGGPKAIIEAALTKTPILSTDVGVARDFLAEEQIFEDFDHYHHVLDTYIRELGCRNIISDLTECNYKKAREILSYEALDRKLVQIYDRIMVVGD